jgi:uncharacterized delta-60 repeat protein
MLNNFIKKEAPIQGLIGLGGGVTRISSSGGESYWIATVVQSGQSFVNRSLTVDSSGNVYVGGRCTGNTNTNEAAIVQLDKEGSLQWSRTLGTNSGTDRFYGLACDSSGNVIAAGSYDAFTQGSNDGVVAKYNSSGTIQWQRTLGGSSSNNDSFQDVAVDSSGNVYVAGTVALSNRNQYLIAKYNSSGTLQWQNRYGAANSGVSLEGSSVAVDGSGNVYAAGYANNNSFNSTVVKLNSSGTLQWAREQTDAGFNDGRVITDSSDNVIVAVRAAASPGGLNLFKYNSSGTLQWKKLLVSSGTNAPHDIAVDDSDNIYTMGWQSVSGRGTDNIITKWNSSGTLQWQRTIGNTTGEFQGGIHAANSSVYVSSISENSSGYYVGFVAKLPDDGSGTGTYSMTDTTDYVYAASSFSTSTSSLSDNAAPTTGYYAQSLNSATLTSTNSSLTDEAVTLSVNKTEVS